MSVAQFSPVLRERIVEIYSDSSNKVDLANFGKKTRQELFKEAPDTKDIRARFKSADFHTSSITLDGITALTSKLVTTIEDGSTRKIVEKLFDSPNFFSDFVSFVEEEEVVSEYGSFDYRIENVPEKNLRDIFVKYLQTNLKSVPKNVIDTMANNVQSGHLAGVFFLKLKTALGVSTKFSSSVEATYRDFSVSMDGLDNDKALKTLDSVLKAVLDADYLTSNLVSESQVFIDATKAVLGDNPRLITELQFTLDNKASGDLLQQTGKQLNLLIQAASKGQSSSAESAVESAIEKLILSLKPVVSAILQKVEDLKEPLSKQGLYDKIKANALYLSEELIDTPGSLTLKQGIAETVKSAIKTGKIPKESPSKIKPKPILQKHKEVLDLSNVAKDFQKAVATLKTAIKNSSIKKKSASVKSARHMMTSNLSSLQILLNNSLTRQIKDNMGDGSRRDILNLRSGRFAESVSVELLSESRQGMITAFYTYMKNPYATFSQGGKQSSPTSRDPKLLISKSIREIAQQQVANRLRAVSI